jgi:hypothetical protein
MIRRMRTPERVSYHLAALRNDFVRQLRLRSVTQMARD